MASVGDSIEVARFKKPTAPSAFFSRICTVYQEATVQ
jgi:hypothetical protein